MTGITAKKAQELALAYVASLDQKKDLNGYRYEFAGISANRLRPGEWAAVFDVYAPTGALVDSPVVLVIDKSTGLVRNLNDVSRRP